MNAPGIMQLERMARKRVRLKLRLLKHLALYVVVVACLATLQWIHPTRHFWPAYPIAALTLGLLIHAVATLLFFVAGDYEERWIAYERRQLRRTLVD